MLAGLLFLDSFWFVSIGLQNNAFDHLNVTHVIILVAVSEVNPIVEMARTAKSTEDAALALKSSSSERLLTSSKMHHGSLSSLGDACGVALLLGNHAKFGLAERCW